MIPKKYLYLHDKKDNYNGKVYTIKCHAITMIKLKKTMCQHLNTKCGTDFIDSESICFDGDSYLREKYGTTVQPYHNIL